MRQPVIEVEIDALVLHGFPSGDQRAIASAFQSALAEALGGMVGAGGLPPSLTHAGSGRVFDAGGFEVARRATPGAMAASAATSLARGLGRGGWR
jgi:hypothetical protein